MPMASLEAYLERLPARLAEVKMMLSEPIAVPHLKKGEQSKMMNSWMKDAAMGAPKKKPVPAMLNMLGIGVRFEKAEGPKEPEAPNGPDVEMLNAE